MKVNIIDDDSGEVIATYTVLEKGLNYDPSTEDLFNSAWRCAVDDGIVGYDDKDDYRFEFV